MAVNLIVAPPYDPKLAAFYGQLVDIVYDMYDKDPNNQTPSPPAQLPGNYRFVAWVQMQDFFIWESPYTFYGLIAQDPSGENDYVLAIRGTSNPIEWWDDFASMDLTPMPGFNNTNVGYGFYQIYQTLRVMYRPRLAPSSGGMAAPSESLEAAGSFADQVAAAVQRHAAESTPPGAARGAKMSIVVAGHSLGSALATLYVAENSVKQRVQTPLLCTLASPRVGDEAFATKFDALGIGSWRIVNKPDVVPDLPFSFLGFDHVESQHLYDSSSWTTISLECWHSIDTYLHLLDPKLPPLPGCISVSAKKRPLVLGARKPPTPAARLPAPVEKEIAVAAPTGTTINITIKVG
jgi:hypothetical protein